MTEQSRATNPLIPSDFFGFTIPLLGEDCEGYQALARNTIAAVHPFDFFESVWAGELVDLNWDIFRLRELKSRVLNVAIAKAIRSVNPIVDQEVTKFESKRDALQCTKDGCVARASDPKLDEFLNSVASTPDNRTVSAHVLEERLDCIDRIDCMIAVYQARRNAILREINHHRSNFSPILHELETAQLELIRSVLSDQSRGKKHGKRTKDNSQSYQCAGKHRPKNNSGQSPCRTERPSTRLSNSG